MHRGNRKGERAETHGKAEKNRAQVDVSQKEAGEDPFEGGDVPIGRGFGVVKACSLKEDGGLAG